MRDNKPASSIISVAKEAGVSLQTVSNVLNFPERVKPETTERVMQAINKLNYTPNLSARRLRSKKSASIAVRVDSNASAGSSSEGLYTGYIQDEFVYEVVKAAEVRDVKVITYTCDPDEDEVKKLKKLVDSRDVDGFLLTSTVEDDPRLKYLIQSNVPFLRQALTNSQVLILGLTLTVLVARPMPLNYSGILATEILASSDGKLSQSNQPIPGA